MANSDVQQRQELEINSTYRKFGVKTKDLYSKCQREVCSHYDATLIITLSSAKDLLLNTSNEITLSYYMLLTNNDNSNLEKYVFFF